MTGRSLWRTGETDASMQQIMREMLFDPIPRAGVRAAEQGIAFPFTLESVVARSVARPPAQRLRDAGAFFAALEDALDGKPAPPLPSADRFAMELEADASGGPALELELAVAPKRLAAVDAGVLAYAPTLDGSPVSAAPSPFAPTLAPASAPSLAPAFGASPTPSRSPGLERPRPLLAEGWRAPWWLVYIVPLAVVGAFVGVVYSLTHSPQPIVMCRLCTVESGLSANGPLPLRELRHDIEERFPELDALCIRDAKQSDRAKLQWTVEGGDVAKGATVAGGGRAGECLLAALTGRQYPILLGENGFGRTDITYTLEWNPTLDPPSPPQ